MDDLSQTAGAEPAEREAVSTPPADTKPAEVKIVDEKAQEAREEADLNAKLHKIFREHQRERSDDGKFASKDQKPAPALNDEAKTKETPADKPGEKAKTPDAGKDKAATPPEKPASKSVQVPQHWPDSVKAKFGTLPPDVQQEIADAGLKDRQAITKIGQAYKALEPTARVLEEFKDTFASRNVSFDAGLRTLLEAQRALDTNPQAALMKIAQTYGIDLRKLVSGQGQSGPDPVIDQLQHKIAQLENKLSARERQEVDDKRSSAEKVYEEFAASHPDIEDLIDDIEPLLPALRRAHPDASYRELLEKAYDKASWANPATRQKRIDDETKAAEQKRIDAARKAADDAKRANVINVESSPGEGEPQDLDAVLRQIHRRHMAA